MPRSARWLVGLLGVAGCVAALWAALALGAPRLLLARIAAAVGAPLAARSASFDWTGGRVVLEDVRVAAAGGQTPLRIRRLAVPLEPRWIWAGTTHLVGVDISGVRLVLRRDATGNVGPAAADGGEPAAASSADRAGPASALRLDSARLRGVRALVIDDATGRRARLRAHALEVAALVASRSAAGASLDLRAHPDGDRAHELTLRARSGAGGSRLDLRARVADLPLRGIGDALGHPELRGGALTGELAYRRRVGADGRLSERLSADGALAHLRLAARGGQPAIAVRSARLRRLRVDAARHRLACADARLSGGAVVLDAAALARPPGEGAAIAPRAWRGMVQRLQVRNVAVRVAGLEGTPRFAARFVAARGVGGAAPPSLRARLGFPNGGTARLHTLRVEAAPALRALARLDRVPLAGLPGAPGEPLRVTAGELSGWAVVLGEGPSIAEAKLAIDGLQIAGRTPGGFAPMLGVARLTAAIDRSTLRPLRLRVREAALVDPSVVVTRTEDGVLPFSLFGELADAPLVRRVLAAPPSDASAGAGAAPPDVPLHVRIHGGTVELDDRRVRPPVSLRLGDIEGEIHQATTTPHVASGELRGAIAPDGRFTLDASIDDERRNLTLAIADLDLSLVGTYLRALIGHTAAGRASLALDVARDPRAAVSFASLATQGLELTQVREKNPFDDALGAPLRRVIEIVERAPGELALDVEVVQPSDAAEPGRAAIARGLHAALVAQVLARLAGGGPAPDVRVARHRLPPIAFPPGKAELADPARLGLEALALLLHLAPDARVTVDGRAGGRDGKQKPAERTALAQARADWVVRQILAASPEARGRVAAGEPTVGPEGGVALEVDLAPSASPP